MQNQTPASSQHRRRHIAWWSYFALYIVLFAVTFANYVSEGAFQSFGGALLSAALLSFDMICIAGLYAYIQSIAVFRPAFWGTVLGLLFARIVVAGGFLAFNLIPWEADHEQYVALVGLLSVLLAIPMLIALWTYAFKSPRIWDNALRSMSTQQREYPPPRLQ